MELIEVIALAHFSDSRVGSVSRKQRLKLPLPIFEQLEELGLVQKLNPQKAIATKNPLIEPLADGGGKSSVLSPVGQASTEKIANSLSNRDGESSQSMIAGNSAQNQTLSTPVMDNGGESTTKKPRKTIRANSGRKTNQQPENTE